MTWVILKKKIILSISDIEIIIFNIVFRYCLKKFMKILYNEKYLEKKKKWITMYYGESYNAKTKIEERLAKLRKLRGTPGRTQDFKLGGAGDKREKNSNTHPYSINKLSTKTNTQKSLFLNILRYNHLLTKTKSLFQMHFPLFFVCL